MPVSRTFNMDYSMSQSQLHETTSSLVGYAGETVSVSISARCYVETHGRQVAVSLMVNGTQRSSAVVSPTGSRTINLSYSGSIPASERLEVHFRTSGSAIVMPTWSCQIRRTITLPTVTAGNPIRQSDILSAFQWHKRNPNATYPYSVGSTLRNSEDTTWTGRFRTISMSGASDGSTITAAQYNSFVNEILSDGYY